MMIYNKCPWWFGFKDQFLNWKKNTLQVKNKMEKIRKCDMKWKTIKGKNPWEFLLSLRLDFSKPLLFNSFGRKNQKMKKEKSWNFWCHRKCSAEEKKKKLKRKIKIRKKTFKKWRKKKESNFIMWKEEWESQSRA